jgi:endonuclease/exonuclease/phosphatase family metal-dependent hydrolase
MKPIKVSLLVVDWPDYPDCPDGNGDISARTEYPTQPAGKRLRVLTMNVQHDAGDPRRTGLLNRELRRLDVDLVALQEVRYPDQLAALVAGTGLRHVTHQARVLGPSPELDRYGGTAVATRWPHRVVTVEERRDGGFHWWTLAVLVRGVLFVVPTTPWEPAAAGARDRQAAGVVALADRAAGPVVVAGDLNAVPSAASVRRLAGRFADAGVLAGDTWTADNPLAAGEIARTGCQPGRLDYVFAGGLAVHAARVVCDRPVDGVWLSDHAAVLAELG